MLRNKRIWTLMATASLLSACAGGPLSIPVSTSPSVISDLFNRVSTMPRQSVKVVFYNRLGNDELVPLVPDAIESLRFNGQFSLDAAAFPRDKGLEQTFPFIEAGEHVIELNFSKQEQPVEIPIVVPRTEASVTIMVILAFDTSLNQLRSVEVGYDMNGDQVLDADMNSYRSFNGQSYLVHLPDGQVQEWNSPLQVSNSASEAHPDREGPLPPGTDSRPTIMEKAPDPQDREKQLPPPVDVPQIPDPQPQPLPEPINIP
ncbi:MAG: hypothetical protein CVV27_18155 [Candidatus Melainabacteria bacterium HGW-Melainabacteria-1]|nr:MAG: hypothetical protein CVV27_18155 [Candidatus Melainabacteria bacterium HGW-Melainabacteria-1]